MRNLYYLLWVDAIVNSKGFKNKEPNWKSNVFFLLTVAWALNFFVILLWLEYFNIDTHKYFLTFKYNSILSSAIGGFLNFGLPFAIINYYLIFNNSRYLRLIEKYPSSYKGKLTLIYGLGSILLVVITVLIIP